MAFNNVKKAALIIMNFKGMEATLPEFLEVRKTTKFTNLIGIEEEKMGRSENLVVGIEAVLQACKVCHRSPPLLWFNENYNKAILKALMKKDAEIVDEIKNWMLKEIITLFSGCQKPIIFKIV